MQPQTLLLAAIAALTCLGLTQAIKCYACIHVTGRFPNIPELKHATNDPKCLDPSSLTSFDAPDDADVSWDQKVFLDPRQLTNKPHQSNSMDLERLFGYLQTSKADVSFEKCHLQCVTATGTIEAHGVGTVTLRGFFASRSNAVGCKDLGRGIRVCTCDKSECNSEKQVGVGRSAASGLEMSFGLIAAAASIGRLV